MPTRSRPPRYGRSGSGTTTEPSGCWWVSISAAIVRGNARADPFSVCTSSGLAVGSGRYRIAIRRDLVVAEVADAADLEPALHAGCPDLEIVLAGLDEAHLSRAHQQDAVRQAEPLEQQLGALGQPFELLHRTHRAPVKLTISTLSNWWTRRMPRVSRPAAPASRRKQGE